MHPMPQVVHTKPYLILSSRHVAGVGAGCQDDLAQIINNTRFGKLKCARQEAKIWKDPRRESCDKIFARGMAKAPGGQ